MQRPPTKLELEHEQARQRERLTRSPSIFTVAFVVVSVVVGLHNAFGTTTAIAIMAVICSAGIASLTWSD